MQEKVSIMGVWCGQKNLLLGITARHHSASLVMPISDPRDSFFYPQHTSMIDTYSLDLNPIIDSISHRVTAERSLIPSNMAVSKLISELMASVKAYYPLKRQTKIAADDILIFTFIFRRK